MLSAECGQQIIIVFYAGKRVMSMRLAIRINSCKMHKNSTERKSNKYSWFNQHKKQICINMHVYTKITNIALP